MNPKFRKMASYIEASIKVEGNKITTRSLVSYGIRAIFSLRYLKHVQNTN